MAIATALGLGGGLALFYTRDSAAEPAIDERWRMAPADAAEDADRQRPLVRKRAIRLVAGRA